jgi:hypothetical protein
MGRREIPTGICLIAGTILLVEYFFKVPALKSMVGQMLNWRTIIFAFTLALGAGNMLRIHGNRVIKGHKESLYSGVLLVGLLGAFTMATTLKTTHPTYMFMWNNILTPGFATSFAMTAFAVTSSAYRAFRVRNPMSAVLMVAAILVMFGRVGLGQAIWPDSAAISDWIMKVPNTAAMRGIEIGAALGSVAVGLRIILGVERSALGTGRD